MDQTEPISLLFYKRILQYKIINPDYAGAFSPEMIASQIKKYTVGCDKNCYCEELMDSFGTTTSTTSSTTTAAPTTTTSTTTEEPTTTTTTTAFVITSYSYTIGLYNCYCELVDFATLFNGTILTENKFYHNPANNTIIKVITFSGIVPVVPLAYIVDSTKKDTCGEVVGCPTTTSTSSSSTSSTSSTSTSSTSSTSTSSTSSTSTSSTSTTTTSSTSTTTTSTTANPFPFTFNLSAGASNSIDACLNFANAFFVKSNQAALGMMPGAIIRNPIPDSLFNGGNQWFHTSLGGNAIQIGGPGENLGVVLAVASC